LLDRVLFHNQYLAVIERDGYTFVREVRCNGIIVALLPFRNRNSEIEFLARLEVCPAHGSKMEQYSITGGVELGESVEEAARKELWEETGYRVGVDDLFSLGQVRPSKSADTIVYLFAIDVTGKSQSAPPGDGTCFEANASIVWVDYDRGIQIVDPLFITAIIRLQASRSNSRLKGLNQ
jgi:8-oxo-dGTP pyrophosphatase MutT (NUDIX family)